MIHSLLSRVALRYPRGYAVHVACPARSIPRSAIKLAMQRHRKGDLPASLYDVTASLSYRLEAVGHQQITQFRAGEEAQLRHALLRAL
jgi:hypothetical protein